MDLYFSYKDSFTNKKNIDEDNIFILRRAVDFRQFNQFAEVLVDGRLRLWQNSEV
jgi:hypothetical protein